MILYSLVCEAGHRFESWFRDSAAYDESAAQGFLSCPSCRSTQVAKAIMAPAVVGMRGALPARATGPEPSRPTPPTAEAPSHPPMRDVVLLDDRSRELRALLRGVRDKVVANGDDVGPRFAAEARRIHDGEAPERQIFGQASLVEARDLIEDGIPILPLPIVPDELN